MLSIPVQQSPMELASQHMELTWQGFHRLPRPPAERHHDPPRAASPPARTGAWSTHSSHPPRAATRAPLGAGADANTLAYCGMAKGDSAAWLVGGRAPPAGGQPSRERQVRLPARRGIPLHCRAAGHPRRVPLRGRRRRKRAAPLDYSFNFGQVEQMAGDNGWADATGSLVWSAQRDRTEHGHS